jgi:hypothetical protein
VQYSNILIGPALQEKPAPGPIFLTADIRTVLWRAQGRLEDLRKGEGEKG